MSKKNSSDTNIGNRTRDLPACSTVPQPTVPPCTACYFVSTDIFPYFYISKQSLSLLTDFTYRCVWLSVCLLRKFSVAAIVFFLPFIGNNSKHDARSWVKNSGFSYRLSQTVVLIENNCNLTGIPNRCDSHDALHYGFCSAHFGKNKVLVTSFSRALNIEEVSKMLWKTTSTNSPVGVFYEVTIHKEYSKYSPPQWKTFCELVFFLVFCELIFLDICPSILVTPCIYFSQCQTLPVTPTPNSSQIILSFVSLYTSLDKQM